MMSSPISNDVFMALKFVFDRFDQPKNDLLQFQYHVFYNDPSACQE